MTGQRQAGFTLIEVVIAIMIMAVISLISWRAIDSVALTSRRLDQHTEEALALQRAFDQFERDIGARSPDLAESAAPAAPEAQAASDAQEAEPQPVLPQLLPEAIRVSGMKTPAP
ncbi:PulJ/GspJ family protein, partial [Achromobacter xylosoxidans]